ncbi:carbohydrate ABC transporter permease [Haloactinopolyspora sp.]|uniref:carbohydrate ABC transporter permease n=1 Tax=Haloactinopolyspora sp. TaxID=1966353 RepID=UPI0026393E2A|nr:carbohydrate ABC transporter permease [Haloactinopolyspora sp.]
MRTRRSERIGAYAILITCSVIALYPFVSILGLALSPPGERPSGFSFPTELYFGNFAKAWSGGGFDTALISSLVVATAVVVGTIVLALPAGYALGNTRGPVFALIGGILVVGLVLPYESMIVALYTMFRDWGLLNTWWALILPQIGLSLSFATLWLRTAFRQTPESIAEAAAIDGASRLRTLRSVLVPIMMPTVLTLATLLFLFTWNEFLLALVLVPDEQSAQTAPLALSFFAGNRRTNDPAVTAAAAVLVALPILITYIFLQRRFITGMLAGAMKE